MSSKYVLKICCLIENIKSIKLFNICLLCSKSSLNC